jgi:glutamate-1-semialdehyde 2,1-aminomutase
VRFCGAYHGWWGDVQPGIGNPIPARETYTLNEMSEAALRVLRTRRDIACVLVNPLQALHPNASPPADSALIDSARSARFDRQAYAAWLKELRAVCSQNGIVLIVDDVFVGFRIAPGGTQEYFGVRADMVTYGKTLGGGLPVGVLCGRKELMKRYRDDRPLDVCFARGTFNAHPYVMTAMNEFLRHLDTAEAHACMPGSMRSGTRAPTRSTSACGSASCRCRSPTCRRSGPCPTPSPSRYNWMFQFYLRAEGLALSWIGTGRLIFSLNYTDADFAAVTDRFVAAAKAMRRDGFWWHDPLATNKSIKRRVLREIMARRFGRKREPGR